MAQWILILIWLVGAGGDLLDYLPSAAYWQTKNVPVSLPAMSAELDDGKPPEVSALIDQLSSDDPQARAQAKAKLGAMGPRVVGALRTAVDGGDPEIAAAAKDLITQIDSQAKPRSVRRLMAIRALGELGDSRALPILQPLLQSREMFEADYAAAAIATIQHRPTTRPSASPADRAADAWNLPRDCSLVTQVQCLGNHTIPLESLLTLFRVGAAPPNQHEIDSMHADLINLAEKVGNFRLQNLTVGASDFGPNNNNNAYAVLVFRGQYDSRALAALLKAERVEMRPTDGVDCYYSFIFGLFMPDNNRLALVLGREQGIPQAIAAVTAAKNTLHDSPAMSPLIAAADKTQPIWAAMKLAPGYRRLMPILTPFDSVTLHSRLDGKNIHLEISAAGTDPNSAKASSVAIDAELMTLMTSVREEATHVPLAQVALTALESIHVTTDGGNMSITAQAPQSPLDAISDAAPATQP